MMLASIAEREQSFPTAGRLPIAFRSLTAAKVQKIFQKDTKNISKKRIWGRY